MTQSYFLLQCLKFFVQRQEARQSQARSPNSSAWCCNLTERPWSRGFPLCNSDRQPSAGPVTAARKPVCQKRLLCGPAVSLGAGQVLGRGGDCPLSLARTGLRVGAGAPVASLSWKFGEGEGVGWSDLHCNLPFPTPSIISGIIEKVLLDVVYRSRISLSRAWIESPRFRSCVFYPSQSLWRGLRLKPRLRAVCFTQVESLWHGLGSKPRFRAVRQLARFPATLTLPSTEPLSCCFVLFKQNKAGTEPLLGDMVCSCSHGKFLENITACVL